jgi:hypothetical protein
VLDVVQGSEVVDQNHGGTKVEGDGDGGPLVDQDWENAKPERTSSKY